jgi:hypothetical protein
VRNKVTSLSAAILTLVAGALFGIQEIGGRALAQAALCAVVLSLPLLALTWKYKGELQKIKHAGPIGILVGAAAFKLLSGYSKLSLFSLVLLVGIMFVFLSVIYTDKELEQKSE